MPSARALLEAVFGEFAEISSTFLQEGWNPFRRAGEIVEAREMSTAAEKTLLLLLEAEDPPDWHLATDLCLYGKMTFGSDLVAMVLEVSQRLLTEQPRPCPRVLARIQGFASGLGDESLELAREFEMAVLEGNHLVLGDHHALTLESMERLSMTLLCLEDLAGANGLLEPVLEAKCQTLGLENRQTLETMELLADSLVALGDSGGARRLLRSPAIEPFAEASPESYQSVAKLAAKDQMALGIDV